ncbi:SPOR domain-containing protein [Lysobacter sp. CFH 32150]|uniref:SPOR domain-containing protein n=1 Tax=Lysobacter sp. CFH 32150 TaxID=2927128 RepID=UPI001FA7C9AF|nr:SPOR domain-containing protein [Lysobacter sp. CFH 32150]MCI4569058.1 SPOR domain-containing protein [Lysobacter sp. CFH 32150]
MAARRGKSQARRNPSNGIPGWAWLIAGVLLGIVVLLAAPRFLKSDAADDFFRPKPNPDARPAANANAGDDDVIVPESAATADEAKPKETQYDFYTVLPGKEVAMSDAELAASARAEAEREASTEREKQAAAATAPPNADNAQAATVPKPDTQAPATTTAIATTADARYILQAGAFGASGDAEAVKAKIALLGLSARVESAQINGKTVYRVRMGPYGTASELAEAKQKLGSNGLPAMAIKAK